MFPRSRAAFSLIELLVVLAVSGILFVSLARFSRMGLNTTALIQNRSAAEQTARVALDRILREAALAKSISSAEATRFAFTCTDITGDGADDTVEYRWNENTHILSRTLNGVSETFADNVLQFSLGYEYETENQRVVASPGTTLPMSLAGFNGVDGMAQDKEIQLAAGASVRQDFRNLIEAPRAASVTLRVKATGLPLGANTYVYLKNVATGELLGYGPVDLSQITTEFRDLTVPITWWNGTAKMQPDGMYALWVWRDNYWLVWHRLVLCYQRITDDRTLGNGLYLYYGSPQLGNKASLYFSVRGNVPATTPTQVTVPVSLLKRVTASITVSDGAQTCSMTGTCKVLNQ